MSNELIEARESEINNNLVSFISTVNPIEINQSNTNTNNENIFKKRIDKLNRMFYNETEKCMDNAKPEDINKSHNKLFLILFKQISLYITEIDRLKHIIANQTDRNTTNNNNNTPNVFNSISDSNVKQYEASQTTINELKVINRKLEKSLNEKIVNEDKRKIELNSLKRQLQFYKEKLQIDLQSKKSTNEVTLMKPILNYSNHKYYSPKKHEEKSLALNQLLSRSPNVKKDTMKSLNCNSNSYSNTKLGSLSNASNKKITMNKVAVTTITPSKNGSSNTLNLKSLVYKGTELDDTTKISIKHISNSKSHESKFFKEYSGLMRYYNEEISELTSLEVFLAKKKNELLDRTKSSSPYMSLDITTEMSYENSLLKTQVKPKRTEHFSLPKEKTKKKQFPMFTSIKIDL